MNAAIKSVVMTGRRMHNSDKFIGRPRRGSATTSDTSTSAGTGGRQMPARELESVLYGRARDDQVEEFVIGDGSFLPPHP
jgi:hypothetical protein